MDIHFIFSPQYEIALTKNPLPYEEGSKAVVLMNKFWKKEGKKIILTFKKVTDLVFKEKEIKCYLNSAFTISDPLSLKMEDVGDMQDNLVHELIHIILTQNFKKIEKRWKKHHEFISSLDSKASSTTRTHVAIHAIHLLIAQTITSKRIKDIKTYSKKKDYVKSWELIDKIGAEKITNLLLGKR